MRKNIGLILFLMVFCLYSGHVLEAKDKDKMVIAIQPTSTPEQLTTQSKELETFLEKRLNKDVEIFFPTSYAGVIEALHFNHADAAFMGSWPAIMARNKANARVILAEIREVMIGQEKKEAPYYFSYWVVGKDSAFQTLQDLTGKRVAFPSQISSSGYVAPMSKLVEMGIVSKSDNLLADSKTFFGDVVFSGGYAQGWEALKAGQVDVTIIAGDVAEKLYREVLDNTRVIQEQGPIPSHVFVVNKNMNQADEDKLTQALLELNAAEYQPLMRKFVSGIFIRFEKASNEHLQGLQKMLDQTGFEFAEKK